MTRTLDHEIIWKAGRLSQALAARADTMLAPFGLKASERAVLEFLYPDAAMTVPQIARRFQVSRQHIQVTVNGLLERGLLLAKDNPDHARSPLIALTGAGKAQFMAVSDAEQDAIEGLFSGLPAGEKVAADRVLGRLLQNLRRNTQS